MRLLRNRSPWWALLLVPTGLIAAAAAYVFWPERGDPRLRAFVHARPPVPIVFTSRTEPASLRAAADEGEGFTYPGRGLWQARKGRLRLLKPNGSVHELTWEKPLPDGSTLIDVMSPSVSIDGKRILFAGRKAAPDHGRFRLYEMNVDGSDLRALTGGVDDAGCTAVPPLRYRSKNHPALMLDDERQHIDYDDVDPVELHFEAKRIAFVSSRTPDFGRHSRRRSTNLWWMRGNGRDKAPLTANRANDRWPFLLASNFLAFSLWSRNPEVVAPGERDVRPWEEGAASPRPPVDAWIGAFVQPGGGQFGGLVKPGVPVWRPRPLFNGRMVFQTRFNYPESERQFRGRENVVYEIAQAEPGLVLHAPSSEITTASPPAAGMLKLGPSVTRDGTGLSRATPSPCPDAHIVLAAMPIVVNARGRYDARGYGIWICRDNWDVGLAQLTAEQADLKLLFDDPDFVDAEPVAIYPRRFDRFMDSTSTPPAGEPPEIQLANGKTYRGPSGTLFGASLYANQHEDAPGQLYPNRDRPRFFAPPQGSIDHVRIYASHRDRFDDPLIPRVPGAWELLLKAPVTGETFGAQVPAGVPIMLAGFDREGRVLSWAGADSGAGPGAAATRFLALAGDHYSAVRPGGKHFCIGCHPGHSGLGQADHRHHERLRD